CRCGRGGGARSSGGGSTEGRQTRARGGGPRPGGDRPLPCRGARLDARHAHLLGRVCARELAPAPRRRGRLAARLPLRFSVRQHRRRPVDREELPAGGTARPRAARRSRAPRPRPARPAPGLRPAVFRMRTCRRLFRGMVRLTESESWRWAFQLILENTRWDLPDADVERHMAVAFEYVMETLGETDAAPRRLDPAGAQALGLAK